MFISLEKKKKKKNEDENGESERSSDEEKITLTLVKETNRVMSLILSFIDNEEEFERPATTRSGRAITRRSEIDFSFS